MTELREDAHNRVLRAMRDTGAVERVRHEQVQYVIDAATLSDQQWRQKYSNRMTRRRGYVQIADGERLPITASTMELARNAGRCGVRATIYEETLEPLMPYGGDSDPGHEHIELLAE